MSQMGQKTLEVDEDIVELVNKGKNLSDIDEIIVETHGEMYRGRAEELLNDMYGGW
jgi:hypothetical protein